MKRDGASRRPADRGVRTATLAPPELLAVDDHLAGCEGCRRRAGALAGVGRSLTGLRGELLTPESHLGEEDVSDHVAGRMSAARQAALERHVGQCETCAREVGELRAWARERPVPRSVPRPVWYAAAAAVLLAVLIPLVAHWRSPSLAEQPTGPSIAGVETLPVAQRQQVEAALREGAAQPPPFLADLAGRPEVLMGASPASSLRLIEPLATAVVSDRPTFRWEPLAGAERYVVSISDEALRPIDQSPRVPGTSWAPDQRLPRGATYVWQVTAHRDGESVTAPAPPAPLAKIRVVDTETARVLDQTAATHPGVAPPARHPLRPGRGTPGSRDPALAGVIHRSALRRGPADPRADPVAGGGDPLAHHGSISI